MPSLADVARGASKVRNTVALIRPLVNAATAELTAWAGLAYKAIVAMEPPVNPHKLAKAMSDAAARAFGKNLNLEEIQAIIRKATERPPPNRQSRTVCSWPRFATSQTTTTPLLGGSVHTVCRMNGIASDASHNRSVDGFFADAAKNPQKIAEFKNEFALSAWKMAKLAYKMLGVTKHEWSDRFKIVATEMFDADKATQMQTWLSKHMPDSITAQVDFMRDIRIQAGYAAD